MHQIFLWRVVEGLGYDAIETRLNADLDRCPPPTSPDPARCRQHWSRSSVREILHNPKYTGFMVWNRRATKKGGRVNSEDAWVWSPEPVHEPIVTMEMYRAAGGVAASTRKSRQAPGLDARHPQTKRCYLLRSFVFCELCGNRMSGKTIRRHSYFACEPPKNLGPKAAITLPDHPPCVYVREDALEEGVVRFFSERVFGPRRRELLEEQLGRTENEVDKESPLRIQALQRHLGEIEKRQTRQVRALEADDDADGLLLRQVRLRLTELEEERQQTLGRLAALEAAAPVAADRHAVDVLDCLPILDFELRGAPEEKVRRLYEAFRLRVRYDKAAMLMRCEVTVDVQDFESLAAAVTHV
ncbi:MAG: recombinase family protein, partial [Actinomycetota bacterium]